MTGTGTILRPADLAATRAAVLDTAGRLEIAGAGTAADWAGTVEPVDAVLDTTSLTGVLAHNPGDMTIAVLAGTPLTALQATLAEHGQRLAFDPARAARGATVGGLLATADAGPLALRYGSLRDLVIGATVVLGDGTVSRSGGHVIKNVAGYDLTKLLHGSFGVLGVLVEVVLRCHPVPGGVATAAAPGELARAAERARTVLESPADPVSVEWCEDRLLVRLEGTAVAVGGRADALAGLLGDGARVLSDAEAAQAWAAHAGLVDCQLTDDLLVDGRGDDAVLRVGCRPSRLAGLVTGLVTGLGATGITAGLATGVATLRLPVAGVAEAHRRVHAAGGTSVLRQRPPGAAVQAWGPALSSLALLRAVRDQLDPDHRLAPGRFAPWL